MIKKESQALRKYFYKPLFETPVLKLILNTKITPNQLTILSIIFSFFVVVLIVIDKSQYFFAAGIVLLFRDAIDCLDGDLARLKNLETDFGHRLDCFSDKLTELSISSAIVLNRVIFTAMSFFDALVVGLLIVGLTTRHFAQHIKRYIAKQDAQNPALHLRRLFYPLKFVTRSILWRHLIIAIGLIADEIILALFIYSLLNIFCAFKESTPYNEWWG